MSAFIVSHEHIDRIVSTANAWRVHFEGSVPEPTELGRLLWLENRESVLYRYPDSGDELPGPCDLTLADIEGYRWLPTIKHLSPVEAIKAAQCLNYQSCEHPTWETSRAHNFLERFKAEAIRRLPGYEDANWEWTS